MRKPIHKTASTRRERGKHGHRFEHWYVDNQIYFITARCKDRIPAFACEQAIQVFWSKLEQYAKEAEFKLIIVSLIDNHYHLLGYCQSSHKLQAMMRKFHGSVAKLVNDIMVSPLVGASRLSGTLQRSERLVPFWSDKRGKSFFDGCIRDERQFRRAFRYTQRQSVRHKICRDYRDYPHTRVYVDHDRDLKRALELGAFMPDVPYARYANTARPA